MIARRARSAKRVLLVGSGVASTVLSVLVAAREAHVVVLDQRIGECLKAATAYLFALFPGRLHLGMGLSLHMQRVAVSRQRGSFDLVIASKSTKSLIRGLAAPGSVLLLVDAPATDVSGPSSTLGNAPCGSGYEWLRAAASE